MKKNGNMNNNLTTSPLKTNKDFEKAISEEKAEFRRQLSKLKKTLENKWVLFKDGKVVESFDDEDTAYAEGLQRYGTDEPFLITCVEEEKPKMTSFALEFGNIYVSKA